MEFRRVLFRSTSVCTVRTLSSVDRFAAKRRARAGAGALSTLLAGACWSAGQGERDVLTRIVAAADRDDDVLLAVDAIGHRRSALRRRDEHRADFFAGHLVVRAQHRAA